jgi:pSer/pThr/pTyr-binding forkhead associated (FHA) protein
MLGRDPAESLVAAAFDGCENVSRRHATVTVDDAGNATIRDENSTNGTFVNGDRVLPGLDVRIVDGDSVRLASDVTGKIVLPSEEPDASGQNGNRR